MGKAGDILALVSLEMTISREHIAVAMIENITFVI